MKKFTSFLTMALMMLMSFSLTSCDEDATTAYYLDGSWSGYMYVQSSYDGQTYTSTYSEITFNAGYNSGTGVWVDYYKNGHWGSRDYVANHIYWKVRDGNIYVHFVEENSDVVIYQYAINDRYFSGKVDAGDSYADFRLTKTSSSNWDDYDWGYWGYNSWSKKSMGSSRSVEKSDSLGYVRRFVK